MHSTRGDICMYTMQRDIRSMQGDMHSTRRHMHSTRRDITPFSARTLTLLLIIINNIQPLNTILHCPQNCNPDCNHDNQGNVVKATCSNIAIQDLPDTLVHLQVSDTIPHMVTSQGRFSDTVLTNKSSLQTLTIHNYWIRIIDGSSFRHCSNLTVLDLSFNTIISIYKENFVGLSQLQFLNLNNNRLSAIKDYVFSELHDLRELQLANNRITTINVHSFFGLEQLQKIDVQSNKITRIHVNAFQDLQNVTEINLQDNMLARIEAGVFRNLSGLRSLSLQNNGIVYLDPASMLGTAGITMLNIAVNKLTAIPTQFLVSVSPAVMVNLARNRITQINTGDLLNVRIKTLYLVANNIYTINPDALQGSYIEMLDLQQNNLQHVPETLANYISQSNSLLLANNPLSCDCDIQWLASILKKDDPQPTCASPRNYFGWRVLEIIDSLKITCDTSASFPVPTKQFPIPPKQNPATPKLSRKTTTTQETTTTTDSIATDTTASDDESTTIFEFETSTSAPEDIKGDNFTNTGLIVGVTVGVIFVVVIAGMMLAMATKTVKVSPESSFSCRRADGNHRPSLKYLHSTDATTVV